MLPYTLNVLSKVLFANDAKESILNSSTAVVQDMSKDNSCSMMAGPVVYSTGSFVFITNASSREMTITVFLKLKTLRHGYMYI